MDNYSRASKLAEIWKQLTWLEEQCRGDYLAGEHLSHADMTWFPTNVFMEYMLPRVTGWPEIFNEEKHFPKLTNWSRHCKKNPEFAKVHSEIWNFWV